MKSPTRLSRLVLTEAVDLLTLPQTSLGPASAARPEASDEVSAGLALSREIVLSLIVKSQGHTFQGLECADPALPLEDTVVCMDDANFL